ncbi:MAG: thioredoxin domain-containing protein, partial [Pyrinomonadaceae bacterium]
MRLSILLIIAMALWVFAVQGQSTAPSSVSQNGAGAPPSPSEIRQIDLDGLKKLLQPDAKDARPLLVNFWATWCDPCREEFPDLVKIDA